MQDRYLRAFAEKPGDAAHSKASLRLWLRLFSCSTVIEKRIRGRLDTDFETTLPRFDVLAALERNRGSLTMTELSNAVLVSNGNVTGVVGRLMKDRLVIRTADAHDRRIASVRLTRKGRAFFLAIAVEHERWIDEMLADLSDRQIGQLKQLLGQLRQSVENHAL